MQSTFD